MNRIATFTLSTLMLSASALAQTTPQPHTISMNKPNGQGDPAAISCYRPPSSTSRVSRLDCRPNSQWAQIYASDNRGGALDLGNRAGGAAVVVEHH